MPIYLCGECEGHFERPVDGCCPDCGYPEFFPLSDSGKPNPRFADSPCDWSSSWDNGEDECMMMGG